MKPKEENNPMSTTLLDNIDFGKPLPPGKDADHFITHDGVEMHLKDIDVRLLTRKPTHLPYVMPYGMVKRVMEDAPEGFSEMYEWLAVSSQYKGKELTVIDEPKTVEEDGMTYWGATFMRLDGKHEYRVAKPKMTFMETMNVTRSADITDVEVK